jgi:hypothetical protein
LLLATLACDPIATPASKAGVAYNPEGKPS